MERLSEAPPDVQTVAQLILGTGQHPNAAINMRWDQFSGEWKTVIDEKGNRHLEVYCPRTSKAISPPCPNLARMCWRAPYGNPRATSRSRSGSGHGVPLLEISARPFVLHGLRKLAIVRLVEAGCSDARIQAITGQSAEMVAYYRKLASRKVLSREALEKRT